MPFNKNILIFALLLLSLKGAAQIFPVQATTQLARPYSLYLSDYTAPGSDRITLNIFLTDPARTDLNVRLRLRIEGQGIRIETKQEYIAPPLTLNGGIPLQLISADLAAYFEPRNLNFTGITQREYEQRGSLPEGLYQFCFEVYEYNRNVKISNTGCATAWLILNDPPIINLPRENEKVRIQSPQQVVFQWTPRHTGSPNSAFTTEYDFKLVEVWPSTRNPNDAILTSRPIYEATTSSTTLIYGAAETALEPGRRYAFQVKARSIAGVTELNLFKNNGKSQVSTFVFGDACLPPQNILADAAGPTRFTVKWDAGTNQTAYNLRYRLASTPSLPERGTGGEVWYTTNSLNPDIEIKSLTGNTRYEYQVSATCGSLESAFSPIATITTKSSPLIAYSCGVPLDPFNLDPAQLIDALKVGDVVQTGDFDVKLTKVTGGGGTFSGEGVIEVAYFNRAKVQAEFTGIQVNKDLRMVSGSMNVTGAGVEVIPSELMDAMDKITEALDFLDKALDKYEENLPKRFDENAFVADKAIVVPGIVKSVERNSDGTVVVTDDKGNKQTIPAGTTAAITDSTGKGYLVDKKGTVHTTTTAVATKAGNREYNLAVKFKEMADQRYGFDEKKHDILSPQYDKLEGGYDVAWKSVATGQVDEVQALLEGTNMDKSKIHFEQAGQPNAPRSTDNGKWTIGAQGKADGQVESILALLTPTDASKKEQVLGQLNVVTYNEIQKNLVIVPVNGNKYPHGEDALRTQLNKIYGQAVVKWNISFATNFDVPGIDPFDDGGSGILSNYSPDMRKVVGAYKANMQANTYYLFLVKNPKGGTLAGYMPRSKECGFIFVDKNGTEEAITHTMAHELGHGAFSLRHTFTEEKNPLQEKSTDNLMDYANGTKLYKYQWDKMRYPEIVMGVFEDDSEAKYETDGHYSTVYLICLMLGMSENQSAELAVATEAPDTDIHNEMDFELDQTWAYLIAQKDIHSLTGGFHGIEEFITAIKILYTPKENTELIGKLLHRYGDTYAHAKLNNLIPSNLSNYNLRDNPELVETAIESWEGQGSHGIATVIEPWIQFFNFYIQKYGLAFLTDISLQKGLLGGKTLFGILRSTYLIKPTDNFKMYGDKFFTLDHGKSDGSYPDKIYLRPTWYKSYVKNLAWILSEKYGLDVNNLDILVFDRMISFAVRNNCSLKGIIDYEIAKRRKLKELYVPVYYSKLNRPIVSFLDAIPNDYYADAKKTVVLTKEYISIDGKRVTNVEDKKTSILRFRINSNGFFNTLAYKINFE
jgi:TANFOR domain-containing protein